MKRMPHTPILAALSGALALAGLPGPVQAQDFGEFDELKVIIEINATDGDVGFHALFDADAWRWAKLSGPDKSKLLTVKASNGLRMQGVTENFFESAEPVCDPEDAEEGEAVVDLATFIGRFPEGDYRFAARTLDGEKLRGSAELTYDLPAAPDIELTEEVAFAFDPAFPDTTPVVVMWAPGEDLGEKCHDESLVAAGVIADPADVEVVGWELVLEPADDEALDPNRKLLVQLPPEQVMATIPSAYLATLWDDVAEEGVLWVKFEIGAIEASHNQTFSEGEFCLYEDVEEDCEADED